MPDITEAQPAAETPAPVDRLRERLEHFGEWEPDAGNWSALADMIAAGVRENGSSLQFLKLSLKGWGMCLEAVRDKIAGVETPAPGDLVDLSAKATKGPWSGPSEPHDSVHGLHAYASDGKHLFSPGRPNVERIASAALAIRLVNDYRAGRLVPVSSTPSARAGGMDRDEIARRMRDAFPDLTQLEAECAAEGAFPECLLAAAPDREPVADLGALDGWQPIATAPKDGTLIGVPGGCANWNVDGKYWYTAVGHDIGRRIQWEVTHWKSLDPGTLPAHTAPDLAAGARETRAVRDVLAERRRQVEVEGWSPEHDDVHSEGEMADAAACYAAGSIPMVQTAPDSKSLTPLWPWDCRWWKPSDARRNAVKAGALIIAEIERLDRSTTPAPDITPPVADQAVSSAAHADGEV